MGSKVHSADCSSCRPNLSASKWSLQWDHSRDWTLKVLDWGSWFDNTLVLEHEFCFLFSNRSDGFCLTWVHLNSGIELFNLNCSIANTVLVNQSLQAISCSGIKNPKCRLRKLNFLRTGYHLKTTINCRRPI